MPRERSDQPLRGYKLAHPMLSSDDSTVAFSGVTIGRSHVYLAVDDALCVHGSRHRCPTGWCDCGFYCFHDIGDARALSCDPEYGQSVLLTIAASGRYLRYEKGLRYARQTVSSVRIGRCGCGRQASVLADSGSGTVGWRRLLPVCRVCVGPRPTLLPEEFGRLAGGLPVIMEDPPPELVDDQAVVPLLHAEVALLQARLDEVQAQLARLTQTSGPGSVS